MNYNSCNPPRRQTCGNGNYPQPSTFYSGPRTSVNRTASCTGIYPKGTQHGFDPYTSLPNNMSTVGQQKPYGYIQRCQEPTPTTYPRSRYVPQQVGRSGGGMPATPSGQMQAQMQRGSGTAAPNPFNVCNPPAPINVNISAAQLASASNCPVNGGRAESGSSPGTKYIPMNWEDILGKTGMNGMKVSMMPGCGDNGNRQLKVSFGGQNGTMQEGETPLKVVSFQPVSTGRIDKNSIAPGAPGSARPIGINMNYETMGQGGPGGRMFDGRMQGQCSCSRCQAK